MSFQWQVDEEGTWEESPEAEKQGRTRRRVNWRWWGVVGVVVMSAGIFASLQLRQRVRQANTDITQAIRAAFNLSLSAAAQNDLELWLTLIDPASDLDWRRREESLLQAGALYDRRAWGLTLLPGSETVGGITLTPDLSQAELPFTAAYQTLDGSLIHLQQTAQFRLRDGQWLRRQGDAAFWDEMGTQEGKWLTLSYPRRDQGVAIRLTADLDALLERLCTAANGLYCLSETYFTVTLSQDNLSLVSTLVPERTINVQRLPTGRLLLPTPSLLGYPTDEAAYQALYQSYARQMVTHLFERVYRWRYTGAPDFFDAAYLAELRQLGLLPTPAATAELPANAPTPTEDVRLLCQTEWDGASLYRYSPTTGVWQPELEGQQFVGLRAIEGHEGVILAQAGQPSDVTGHARLFLWRKNQLISLSDLIPGPSFPIITGDTSDNGRNLLFTFGGRGRQDDQLGSINMVACDSGNCAVDMLPHAGTLSPDEAYALSLSPFSGPMLYLVNNSTGETRPLAPGYATFWLDNDTFGFMQTDENGGAGVVDLTLGRVSAPELEVVLPAAELQAVALTHMPADVTLRGVWTQSLSNHEILLIGWSDLNDAAIMPMHIMRYDVDSGALTWLADRSIARDLLVAPGGRHLVTQELAPDFLRQQLFLLDLARGQGEEIPLAPKPAFAVSQTMDYGWSADGAWLLLLDGGVLHFIMPETGSHYRLRPPVPGCTYAAWGN